MLDLVLRGCRLPDREVPVDLAIADGRIVAIGPASGPARETIDVAGRLGLLGSAETVGRLIFGAGALVMLAALLLLALEVLRCWNAPAADARPR